ncbi:MAG: VWA domain-containing protein [Pseudomonadota bacterium]
MPEFLNPNWLWAGALIALMFLLRPRVSVLLSKSRRYLSMGLRTLAVAMMVLALAGPLRPNAATTTNTVFVLDVSASVRAEALDEARAFINQAFAEKHREHAMGLVVFGANAATETLLSELPPPVAEITSEVATDGTDLAAGIELALSALPASGTRKIVVMSDGQENHRNAVRIAEAARSMGVNIWSVPLAAALGTDEVRVADLDAPGWVRVNEPFEISISVHSDKPGTGQLVLMRNGIPLSEAPVTLEPGANAFSIVDQLDANGLHEYEVILNSDDDSHFENNRYQTFVQARGKPRVLHAASDPTEAQYVTQALRVQGLQVEDVPATALPANLSQFADFDLVVLSNVSGFELSSAKMDALEEYVRDLGGGLVAVGGDKAYGAGGYYSTPIERVLPVDMDMKTDVAIPISAVNILIDKSGSMSSQVQGKQKLAIAKRAALAAIEVLNPLDRIGVLAFDSAYEWAVEPTEAGARHAIAERLGRMGVGGGTDLYSALDQAHQVARAQNAKVKHIIILSDGLTDSQGDFEALATQIAKDNITISTVAFGNDADKVLMKSLATLANGRFYYASDPNNIPRIFTSETLMISRDLFVEKTFVPALLDDAEMLSGLAANDFPPLHGYQRTYPKPPARVLLSETDGDPLLAAWQYGLGRSTAFMSDFSARWGRDWVKWEEFSQLIAQIARWTMRRQHGDTLVPRFQWQGQTGEVLIDALDRNDAFINGLRLRATIAQPGRDANTVDIVQTGPGRYRGTFPVLREGRYYMKLTGESDDGPIAPKLLGFAVPYSAEYLGLGLNQPLLERIAKTTGGEVAPPTTTTITRLIAEPASLARQLDRSWWPWLLAALAFVLLEVAVRKIEWRRGGAAR